MLTSRHIGIELVQGHKVQGNGSVRWFWTEVLAMASKSSEMDVSEVCEMIGATIHGMIIGELSPTLLSVLR